MNFKYQNKQEVLDDIEKGRTPPMYQLSTKLLDDEDVVFKVLMVWRLELSKASDRLQKDRNFIKRLVEQKGKILGGASQEFKEDYELASIAFKNDGSVFEFLSSKFQSDKAFFLAGTPSPDSLKFASQALKNDKEVVMYSVAHNGHSLQHAGIHVKSDKDVVSAAVIQTAGALLYASASLQRDRDLNFLSLSSNHLFDLDHVHPIFFNDLEFVYQASKIMPPSVILKKLNFIKNLEIKAAVMSAEPAHEIARLWEAHQAQKINQELKEATPIRSTYNKTSSSSNKARL